MERKFLQGEKSRNRLQRDVLFCSNDYCFRFAEINYKSVNFIQVNFMRFTSSFHSASQILEGYPDQYYKRYVNGCNLSFTKGYMCKIFVSVL